MCFLLRRYHLDNFYLPMHWGQHLPMNHSYFYLSYPFYNKFNLPCKLTNKIKHFNVKRPPQLRFFSTNSLLIAVTWYLLYLTFMMDLYATMNRNHSNEGYVQKFSIAFLIPFDFWVIEFIHKQTIMRKGKYIFSTIQYTTQWKTVFSSIIAKQV